jgi:hypothetical protein
MAGGTYSVKGAYKKLAGNHSIEVNMYHQNISNSLIHLIISVLVWRLLQNMMPTKDNLLQRRALSMD